MTGRRTWRLPILTYHVVPREHSGAFASQMSLLARRGIKTITFGHLTQLWRRGADLPARTVVLTFDDGTLDHHDVVFPVLREWDLHATFFVSPGLLGRDLGMVRSHADKRRKWIDDPREWDGLGAKRFTHMTWSQVERMREGGQEIGSHGMTHPFLTTLGDEDLRFELQTSQELLRSRLKIPVESFCYPFGDESARVRDAVQAAGYLGACVSTTDWGSDVPFADPFALGRIPVQPELPLWRFYLVVTGLDFVRRRIAGWPGMDPVLRAKRRLASLGNR